MINTPIFRAILSSLLPQKCEICSDFFLGVGACSICFSLLKERLPPLCKRCGQPLPPAFRTSECLECTINPPKLDGFSSRFDYEPICGPLLRRAKRCGQPTILTQLLERQELRTNLLAQSKFDSIIPIPDRADRFRRRGFSSTLIIGERLSKVLDVPLRRFVLSWRKPVRRQTGLTKHQRQRNVLGAFSAKRMSGERVLLIDDVYTTGATMNQAAKTLKASGASRVEGFALCSKKFSHTTDACYNRISTQ